MKIGDRIAVSLGAIAMQPATYGQTYTDAVKNAQEAIEGYLAYCAEEGLAVPAANMLQVA